MKFKDIVCAVTSKEGGKKNQNVAEVSETVRHTLDYLATLDPVDVLILLRKRKPNG